PGPGPRDRLFIGRDVSRIHRRSAGFEETTCRAQETGRPVPVAFGGSRFAEPGDGVRQQVAVSGSMGEGKGLPPQADCGVDVAESQLDRPQVARLDADHKLIAALAVEVEASTVELPGPFVIAIHTGRLSEAVKGRQGELLVASFFGQCKGLTAEDHRLTRVVVPQADARKPGQRTDN